MVMGESGKGGHLVFRAASFGLGGLGLENPPVGSFRRR